MMKIKAQLETETANGVHTYTCATNTPVTEVIEALKSFLTYANGLLKQQEDQQKAADVEPKPEC